MTKTNRRRAAVCAAIIGGLIITAGLGWAVGERRKPPRLFSDIVATTVTEEGEMVAAYYRYPPHGAVDIGFVAQAGWFVGKPDGSYDPSGKITAAQMAKVIARAFPEGMSRAEFASFLRGGQRRVNDTAENLGLLVAPEEPAGYDRSDWEGGGWPENTNLMLRWSLVGCRWAFYSVQTEPDCGGNNHRGHLVAAAEAHESGGHSWDEAERRRFYLDVENIFVLPAGENTAKGARDPAEWLPDRNRCEYIRRWVAIKRDYRLAADRAEMDVIAREIVKCGVPDGGVVISIPGSTTTTTTAPTTTTTAVGEDVAATGPEVWNRYRAAACSDWMATDGWPIVRLRMMVADADAFGYDWGQWDDNGDGYPCEGLLGDDYLLIRGAPPDTTNFDFHRAMPCELWLKYHDYMGTREQTITRLRYALIAKARDIGYDWGAGMDPDGDGEPCEDIYGDGYLADFYPYAIPAYRRPG